MNAKAEQRPRWRALATRALRASASDRVRLAAAGCAFYATLALFPGVSIPISVYGWSSIPPASPRNSAFWPSCCPRPRSGRSTTASAKSLLSAVNIDYDLPGEPSSFQFQALGLAMTLAATISAALAIAILVALPASIGRSNPPPPADRRAALLRHRPGAKTRPRVGIICSGKADVAALAEQMDLTISVCTAGAHLAGAAGLPTWIPLDHYAFHVWLTDRDDSPWYPLAQLFRRSSPAIGRGSSPCCATGCPASWATAAPEASLPSGIPRAGLLLPSA